MSVNAPRQPKFEILVDEGQNLHLAHRRQRYREEAQRAIKLVFTIS